MLYLVCARGLRLAGDQRLQEVLNIIGSEPGHRLLLKEILDDIRCLADGADGRVTEQEENNVSVIQLRAMLTHMLTEWMTDESLRCAASVRKLCQLFHMFYGNARHFLSNSNIWEYALYISVHHLSHILVLVSCNPPDMY